MKNTHELTEKKLHEATTCALISILGVSVVKKADEESLTRAYGVLSVRSTTNRTELFAQNGECRWLESNQEQLVNLISSIVYYRSFFQVFLSLKPKATKNTKEIFATLSEKLWNCYKAPNKSSFSLRYRRLSFGSIENNIPETRLDKIEKFKKNITSFQTTYQHPNAYRTSNLLDRLMVRMVSRLFDTQYFQGTLL